MDEQRATFVIVGPLSGERCALSRRKILIGSDAACDIRLDEHFTISGTHARIEWDGENFYLTDADPANATFVNSRQAEFNEPIALANGDVVHIGPYSLSLKRGSAALRIEVSRLLVKSSFVIKRSDSDKKSDEVKWEHEVLLICNPPDQAAGGSPDGKLILNHPKVSALHAGISRFRDHLNQTKSRFYLIDLSPSNTTHLKKRLLRTDEPAELATNDVAQIGPYDLTFTLAGEDTLRIDVTLSVAGMAGVSAAPARPAQASATVPAQVAADTLRIFWAKRTRAKTARRSPLQPSTPERVDKARYKWRATTDLARPWPITVLLWCALVSGAVLVLGMVLIGMNVFAPRQLSAAHATFITLPATARQPSANACTTCHTRGRSMDDNCASCHQSPDFTATITEVHKKAGLGCTSCHVEHQGTEFRPSVASLETCLSCHNDANTKTFSGMHPHTPHGGTFGYPVVGGKWKWAGLPKEEWQQKSTEVQETMRQNEEALKRTPARTDTEQKRRSMEFHTLHIYRVKAPAGFAANSEGEMSCSSCHKSFAPIDRATPSKTCGKCHNGRADAQTKRALIAADQPNCLSCHVQHVMDKRRTPELLVATGESGRP